MRHRLEIIYRLLIIYNVMWPTLFSILICCYQIQQVSVGCLSTCFLLIKSFSFNLRLPRYNDSFFESCTEFCDCFAELPMGLTQVYSSVQLHTMSRWTHGVHYTLLSHPLPLPVIISTFQSKVIRSSYFFSRNLIVTSDSCI